MDDGGVRVLRRQVDAQRGIVRLDQGGRDVQALAVIPMVIASGIVIAISSGIVVIASGIVIVRRPVNSSGVIIASGNLVVRGFVVTAASAIGPVVGAAAVFAADSESSRVALPRAGVSSTGLAWPRHRTAGST